MEVIVLLNILDQRIVYFQIWIEENSEHSVSTWAITLNILYLFAFCTGISVGEQNNKDIKQLRYYDM